MAQTYAKELVSLPHLSVLPRYSRPKNRFTKQYQLTISRSSLRNHNLSLRLHNRLRIRLPRLPLAQKIRQISATQCLPALLGLRQPPLAALRPLRSHDSRPHWGLNTASTTAKTPCHPACIGLYHVRYNLHYQRCSRTARVEIKVFPHVVVSQGLCDTADHVFDHRGCCGRGWRGGERNIELRF